MLIGMGDRTMARRGKGGRAKLVCQ